MPTCLAALGPGSGIRLVVGKVAGAPVELLNALGRRVRQWPAPAAGQDLPLPLTAVPAGLYLVRCGARTQRLLVE